MGLVRLWVAPLLGNCSWVALLPISEMMLSRDFCFLHLSMHVKTRAAWIQNIPVHGQDTGLEQPQKAAECQHELLQVCSMEVSSADSAASQQILLPADPQRSRTNTSALPTTISHAASIL